MLFKHLNRPFLVLLQICLVLLGCHDTERENLDKKNQTKQIQNQIKRLDSMQVNEVNTAIQELRQIGSPAVPALIEALTHHSAQLSANSAQALPVMGSASYQAIPALIRALADRRVNVRQQAAFSLGLIGALTNIQPPEKDNSLVKEMVPALITALGDQDLAVCSNAASALGMLGEVAVKAVPLLIQALDSPNPGFRADVVAALALIGKPKNMVISTLTRALNDESSDVQQCATFHLERLNSIQSINSSP